MSEAILRNMEETDLELVREWRNKKEIRNNMYNNHIITSEEHLNWWNMQSTNSQTKLLILEISKIAKGVVIFTDYTGINGTASWAFYSGDISAVGLGVIMESLALEYAFSQLKVRKLICEVLSFNKKVVNFHRKFGFKIEGIFKEAYLRDSIYYDIYRLALFNSEWSKYIIQPKKSAIKKLYKKEIIITKKNVVQFIKVLENCHPIDSVDEYTIKKELNNDVASCILSLGYLSSIFGNDFPVQSAICLSQKIEFLNPIIVNSKALIILKVISFVGKQIELETNIYIDDTLCITGEVLLLSPSVNYL